MNQTITFDVVKRKGLKRYKCSCGKMVVRQRTFEQTINPWNKNRDGFPKSRGEIILELEHEIKTWSGKSDICSH